MSCLSYDEHFASMGLPRLELRRLHLDLMYCYKIVFGLVTVNINDFLSSDLPLRPGDTHISCLSHVAVFVVISLLNVLSTCGIASHHLFAFLLCPLSDEQHVMLILQIL